MNTKQTTPIAAALAPLAVVAPELIVITAVGCGVYFGLKWLLSDDKDKKPEMASSPSVSERPAFRPPVSAGNNIQKNDIPPVSATKPALTPAPPIRLSATVQANSVPVARKIPIPSPSAIPAVKIQPEIPIPPQKKTISRENMAEIFRGGRGMTRKAAVSALKALGFGKTAAYQALEINGRFAPWLQFASDGIITWKNY